MTTCTRCDTTGFLNICQLPENILEEFDNAEDPQEYLLRWLDHNHDNDVQVCDCCGDGENWYSEPGYHDRCTQPIFNCM